MRLHTDHCADRIRWGDAVCECGAADFRLIVTGGRGYDDTETVRAVLDRALAKVRPCGTLIVVHGAAAGLDTLAHRWAVWRAAEGHLVRPEPHPADWANGRRAGPVRNARMVALGADACVSFPGGRGTADCTQRAVNAGIRVGAVSDGSRACRLGVQPGQLVWW